MTHITLSLLRQKQENESSCLNSRDLQDLASLISIAPKREIRLIFTLNLHHMSMLLRDASFRNAYSRADIITLDSRPLHIYLSITRPKQITTHVTGADLFSYLFSTLNCQEHKIVFVCPTKDVGELLLQKLCLRGFNNKSASYFVPPFGFEKDTVASKDLADKICATKPTHIFLGVGAPRSELWAAGALPSNVSANVLCCGAALQFEAGVAKRAPRIFRRLSLEWLWRMCGDPKRLAVRYIQSGAALLRIFATDFVSVLPFVPNITIFR